MMCTVPRTVGEFLGGQDTRPREFYEFIMPPVDIMEDGNELVILIDLPGFTKSEINIKIIENTLSIIAMRQIKDLPGTIYSIHRPVTINRKLRLPISSKDYENEKIIGKATYVDGVVTLRILLKNRVKWV